jgi:hypothetical protein
MECLVASAHSDGSILILYHRYPTKTERKKKNKKKDPIPGKRGRNVNLSEGGRVGIYVNLIDTRSRTIASAN